MPSSSLVEVEFEVWVEAEVGVEFEVGDEFEVWVEFEVGVEVWVEVVVGGVGDGVGAGLTFSPGRGGWGGWSEIWRVKLNSTPFVVDVKVRVEFGKNMYDQHCDYCKRGTFPQSMKLISYLIDLIMQTPLHCTWILFTLDLS